MKVGRRFVKPPQSYDLVATPKTTENDKSDSDFQEAFLSPKSHLLPQENLKVLVCDLNLSKQQAEILGSRLKEWSLLRSETKVCYFSNRDEELKGFFSQDDRLVFCNNVNDVMTVLDTVYKAEERLYLSMVKN